MAEAGRVRDRPQDEYRYESDNCSNRSGNVEMYIFSPQTDSYSKQPSD